MSERPSPLLLLSAGLALAALTLPATRGGGPLGMTSFAAAAAILVFTAGLGLWRPRWQAPLAAVGAHAAAFLLISGLLSMEGRAGTGFWACAAASWLAAWACAQHLAGGPSDGTAAQRGKGLLVPLLFGLWILILWELLVRGFHVPGVLLPPPSAVAARLVASAPTLAADFRQTFKAVLVGYAVGSLAGFAAAILVDRVPFLRRGLLPIGNLVSALPIVGIAPITVMWFGFDWPSKAAVVIVMTFFPMLVNTVAGLAAAGAMERDLMRTYGADYRRILLKLRLPAALPFIFNALKINSTLALIGAIVAEFFGTPIVGMGFRISTEVGRMNIDMVWAEIAVAALAGSLFYGAISTLERASTFWHPSFR